MKNKKYNKSLNIKMRIMALVLAGSLSLVVMVMVMSGTTLVYGHDDDVAQGSVQQLRSDAMRGVTRTMRRLSRIRGNSAQDAKDILSMIPTLKKGAGDNYTKLFPVGSNSKKASPAIWQDFSTFRALSNDFDEKINQLQQLAEKNRDSDVSFSATLDSIKRDLGASCRSCHSRFQLD